MQGHAFNEVYFEEGIRAGVSCYQDYRWIPSLHFKLARSLIEIGKIRKADKILDFGTAKGYLVRAFRELNMFAWGCDISEYAINKADPKIEKYCFLTDKENFIPTEMRYDVCICKDVLEHISKDEIDGVLQCIRNRVQKLIVVVPLGINGRFIIEEYHRDNTHQIAESISWWASKFTENGLQIANAMHLVPGVKDNWIFKLHGNGIFILNNA